MGAEVGGPAPAFTLAGSDNTEAEASFCTESKPTICPSVSGS